METHLKIERIQGNGRKEERVDGICLQEMIDLDAAVRLAPEKENNRDTVLLGTAVYAAPEQFGLTRSDARTDIFALGIKLNIMLTGKHPAVEQYKGQDAGLPSQKPCQPL